MTDQEFENIIKKNLKTNAAPNRVSFAHLLSQLQDVTDSNDVRYNRQTASPSNIINNKITDFIAVWKSKRIVLVPSLILLLFIGAFSLSKPTLTYDKSIMKLAQQDESIIEKDIVDDDDSILLTGFDDQAYDELSTTQNEL